MKITDETKGLGLESPYFKAMRLDLDYAIKNAIRVMGDKNIGESDITLKIGISTMTVTRQDENSPTGIRTRMLPEITYKVTTALKAKSEAKGNVVDMEKELVQDDTGAYFILTKEEASGQLTLFNSFDELPDEDELPGDDEEQEDDDE